MNVMCLIVHLQMFCVNFIFNWIYFDILIPNRSICRYDFLCSTPLCSVQVIFIYRFNLFKKVSNFHYFQRKDPTFCKVKIIHFSLEAQELRAECPKLELPHMRKVSIWLSFFETSAEGIFYLPRVIVSQYLLRIIVPQYIRRIISGL